MIKGIERKRKSLKRLYINNLREKGKTRIDWKDPLNYLKVGLPLGISVGALSE